MTTQQAEKASIAASIAQLQAELATARPNSTAMAEIAARWNATFEQIEQARTVAYRVASLSNTIASLQTQLNNIGG